MTAAKNASRFAVLSVDDDDDEDTGGFSAVKKRGGDKVSAKNFGPYVVSNQANQTGAKKKKRKGKPTTKAQGENNFEENADDGYEENELNKALTLSRQEFAEREVKRKEEEKILDETLQNSLVSSNQFKHSNKTKVYAFRDDNKTAASASFEKPSSASSSEKTNGPSSDVSGRHEHLILTSLLADVDTEADRIRKLRPNSAAGDAGKAIVVLYRNKCLELKKVIQEKDDENSKLKAENEKLKQKNKVYFQLFKDAETKEKAEILHDINKVKTINDELTEQISSMDAELQQVKSRNHELDIELKKLTSAKQARQ